MFSRHPSSRLRCVCPLVQQRVHGASSISLHTTSTPGALRAFLILCYQGLSLERCEYGVERVSRGGINKTVRLCWPLFFFLLHEQFIRNIFLNWPNVFLAHTWLADADHVCFS